MSGDVHGANLAQALMALRPDLELLGWGSHRMAAAGVTILQDLTPWAAVGLTENLAAIAPARRALAEARRILAERRPEVVVLIDYQGANMSLAHLARKLGIPTVYYISPQEWIWGFRGGPGKVAAAVDLILAIFRKEAAVYEQAGGRVRFVGHPLLDQAPTPERLAEVRTALGLSAGQPVLGLFPGSRKVEITRLLPRMCEAAAILRRQVPDLEVLLPVASPNFRHLLEGAPGVRVVETPGMEIMALATAALAASGTVTLEAAVVGTPVVATYQVSALTAWLARRVFRVGHVSLPNIVAGEAIVPELLQGDGTPERLAATLLPLIVGGSEREVQQAGLARVRDQLGEPGASLRAAREILGMLATGPGAAAATTAG